MRKRSVVVVPLLALAALTAYAPAAAPVAAFGGDNVGANFDCVPGSPQVVVQFNEPKQITGTAGLTCPAPGSTSPAGFGPTGQRNSTPPPPTVGSPCHFDFETPVKFRLNGSTEQFDTQQPTSANFGIPLPSVDPAAPTFQDNGWADLSLMAGGSQDTADHVFALAGTNDLRWHWVFDGTWTQVGTQVKCVSNGPTNGWNTTCNINTLFATACFDVFPPAVPPASAGLDVAGLNVDLNAFLQGQFFGGRVSSLPNRPHPGLTNVPTCFSVSGMTVNGQIADPQRDVFWERIVEGPADGEGRSIFFVFVIHVSLQDTVWDFGDGTTMTIAKGGASTETPPPACGAIPGQQFLVAHTYHRYSTGDGFHVTVHNHFGVDVTELWRDSAPNPHRLDFPNAVPLVDLQSLPQPAYVMPIVQEEGVPVG